MRVLSSTERNELVIEDAMSGGELKVYYRTPTSRERAGYQARSVVREKGKVKLNVFEARQVFGMKIITGIGEGCFGIPGPSGAAVAISSDPQSPHFRREWKQLIEEHASDVLQTLAYVVFEGTRVGGQEFELDENGTDDELPADTGVDISDVDAGADETGPLAQTSATSWKGF